jgi:RNA polymerase sigma factor (sigma-70 family)
MAGADLEPESAFYSEWKAVRSAGGSSAQLVFVAFIHCRDMVHALARRITGTAWEADDVTQSVFEGLSRSLHTIRDPRRIPGFLRTCTIRTAARMVGRSRRQREQLLSFPQESEDSGPIVLDDSAALRGLIERLPPEERSAVFHRYVERRSHGEVAELLGVSLATARRRARAGREKLLRWWGKDTTRSAA